MKAKELAEILLRNPNAEVNVACQGYHTLDKSNDCEYEFERLFVMENENQILICDSCFIPDEEIDKYGLIDIELEGTEICYECGAEIDYIYRPMIDKTITCPDCGTKQHACSLCDPRRFDCCFGESDDICTTNIIKSLKYDRKEE